jgi:hypothetical protein
MPGDDADEERKIIDTIYRGACDPAELQHAIERVARYFDSGGAFLGEFDQAAPENRFVTGTIDHAFLTDYEPYAPLDPAPRAFAALKLGTVSTTDRMFSAEFLRTNAFLNEFLIPHGIDATLAGPLSSERGRFAMVAVHQPPATDALRMRMSRALNGSRRISPARCRSGAWF